MLTTLALLTTGALAVVVVMQRWRYSDSLAESEARLRTLVENAPEALVVFDVESGHFVELNERAERLFDRSREELMTLGPADVSPEILPTGEAAAPVAAMQIQKAIEGGTPSFEWWHTTRSGELVPCGVRLVRLPARGRVLVRGSIVDITVQKEAEARQRILEAQLRQSRKLEAVGQLTGGVAHDFNNILTVAMGNLELMLDGFEGADGDRDLAEESLSALGRAAVLTSQLLAFSRRQPLAPEALDVGGLVLGLLSMLRRTLGETIEVREVVDDDLWPALTDRAQLENAILNLTLNARDAMPTGGVLSLEVMNQRVAATLMESWYQKGRGDWDPPEVPATRDFVTLTVTDLGIGMDRSTLERAFEPFFTTKEVGKGSGLGLSMIYGFAKQSGGHAEIESEPGVGTTVRIYLPRARETEVLANAAPTRTEGRPPRSPDAIRRVLVVEDDPGARSMAVAMLESLGYECDAVADGHEALARLEVDSDFDLLFTDVVLPGGIGGVQLGSRARERQPDLGVVLCSGYSEEDFPEAIEDHDLGPVLEKPYTRQDLSAALRVSS